MTQATTVINESKLNVRWREEYISQGVNRKTLALPRGVYRGLWLSESAVPDTNLNLVIDPDSLGMDTKHFAHIEDDSGSVSLSFTDTTDPIVTSCSGLLPVGGGGATWKVWVEISYSTSAASAATIYVDDTGAFPSDDAVNIGEVVFAGAATTVEEGTGAGQCSFVYTNRQTPAPTDVSAYSSYSAGDRQWGMISGEERHAIDLTKDMVLGETKHVDITAPASVDSGTQTGTSATVLTDVAKSWTINEHIGRVVVNIVDDSCGVIVSNAATTVTVAALVKPNLVSIDVVGSWSPSDTYVIYETKTQLTGWFYIGEETTGTAHQYFSAHVDNVVADDYLYSAITGVSNFNLDGSGVYLKVLDSLGVQLNPSVDATNGFYQDPVLQLRSVGDSLWGDNPLPIVDNFIVKAFERESFVDLEQSPPAAIPNTGLYNYKKSGSSISMPEYQNQAGPLLLSADTLTEQVKEIVDATNASKNFSAAIGLSNFHLVNAPSDTGMDIACYHPAIGVGTWLCVTSATPSLAYLSVDDGRNWSSSSAVGSSRATRLHNSTIDSARFLLLAVSATTTVLYSTDGVSWSTDTGPNGAGATGGCRSIATKYGTSDYIVIGTNNGEIAHAPNVGGSWTASGTQPSGAGEITVILWLGSDDWFCCDDTGQTYTSIDNAITWIATTTKPSDVSTVTDEYGHGGYNPSTGMIVIGGADSGTDVFEVFYSLDRGVTWNLSDVSNIRNNGFSKLILHCGEKVWVTASDKYNFVSMDDGVTWYEGKIFETGAIAGQIESVKSNGQMLMIADDDAVFASSVVPGLQGL